jgi:hypothetical protein
MKRTLIIILFAFMGISCTKSQKGGSAALSSKDDYEKEKEAILNVIETETRCFFEKNYVCWQNTYAHKDYSTQIWNNDDGTINAKVGWDKIREATETFIKNNPGPGGTYPRVERKNILYTFFGDEGAYITWDQYNSDEEEKIFYRSKEVRVMEKEKGRWKIVNVSAFWDTKNIIPVDSLEREIL